MARRMRLEVDIREKRFGAALVLGDLRFTVTPGETLAVLGPSGVGKSTLLRIVAGLDPAFHGQVERPDRIAMVFQEPTLLPWRRAIDNLKLTAGVDTAGAEAALERTGLGGKAGLFPRQLSLGQQRRLALARAYAARPALLLLDEPFVSLDSALVGDMLDLTETLIREIRPITLFVTHSAAEAGRLATSVLRLQHPAAGRGRPDAMQRVLPAEKTAPLPAQ